MFAKRQNDQYNRPAVEPLAARKRRQALEASEAMRDYLKAQQAASERLRALREERVAREAQQNEVGLV